MKAINGDHVPEHVCAASPNDPSCCATCSEKLNPCRYGHHYVGQGDGPMVCVNVGCPAHLVQKD